MKIYTKTGDKGSTSLLSGKRVPKHHIRINSYGEIDNLNSILGLCIAYAKTELKDKDENITTNLTSIQHQLFNIGSLLASDQENPKIKLPEISLQSITHLETEIDKMSVQLPELKEFILPGGNLTASHINLARTSSRKCERLVTQLNDTHRIDELILIYLNRLSDYLFTLARYANFLTSTKDITWKKEL